MKLEKITVAWLKKHKACLVDIREFHHLFPVGMELTRQNVLTCHQAGLDVIWAGCLLLTSAQRRAFAIYSLHQRLSPLMILLDKAGLKEHKRAVSDLDFKKPDLVTRVLDAAGSAALRCEAVDLASPCVHAAMDAVAIVKILARDRASHWLKPDDVGAIRYAADASVAMDAYWARAGIRTVRDAQVEWLMEELL